jgi:hypothetical protein
MNAGRPHAVWLLPAAIASMLVLVYVLVFSWPDAAVYVTVVNHGPETLRTVTVQVTGRAHVLGDLAADQSVRRKALPTDPTGVAIEYTDAAGRRVRLDADGQFKPGDRGEVIIELKDGKIATSWFNLIEGG